MLSPRQSQRGRSLLEMIAVMAIMAMLAGISISLFKGVVTRQEADRDYEDIQLFISAVRNQGTLRTDKGMADAFLSYKKTRSGKNLFKLDNCPQNTKGMTIRLDDIDDKTCERLMKKKWDGPFKPLLFLRAESDQNVCLWNGTDGAVYRLNTSADCVKSGAPEQGAFAVVFNDKRDNVVPCSDDTDCGDCEYCSAKGVCENDCGEGESCAPSADDPTGEKDCCPNENVSNDGVCVSCEEGTQYDLGRDKCVPVCTNQQTCSNQTDVWCCDQDLTCGELVNQCANGLTCQWDFITSPTQADCSVTITNNVQAADCYVVVSDNPSNNSFNFEQTGCSAGQYCYVHYRDENCQNFIYDNSFGTLYGTCNNLAEKKQSCAPTQTITETGCGAGQYCYVHYRDENCQNFIYDNSFGTLYGTCNNLAEKNQNCYSDTLTVQERIPCLANQYCYLKWGSNTSCSNAANTATSVYGVCSAINEENTTCPY